MVHHNALAHLAISQDPQNAAAIIEHMHSQAVADFVRMCETEPAAKLLTSLRPAFAADVIGNVTGYADHDTAAQWLDSMAAHSAAAILRQCSEVLQDALLAELAGTKAQQLKTLISYNADSVGALAHTDMPIIPGDWTIAQTREQLSQTGKTSGTDIIYITTRDHRLKGSLSPAALIQADADTQTAETLICSEPYRLYTGTRLSAVVNHTGWKERDILPVIERDSGMVIGGLPHSRLLSCVYDKQAPAQTGQAQSFAGLYAGTLLALFETAAALLQPNHDTRI